MSKLYVLSLGGSLIAPAVVDHVFLQKFKELITKEIKKGNRFIMVCGGGGVSRMYQQALAKVIPAAIEDLDWMGIAATHLNARLMQLTFGRLAHRQIVSDPNHKAKFKEKILLVGGWKPGRSSDDVAVRLAKTYNSSAVINLSNIDYVYDKDPRKYKTAKSIEHMTWGDYRAMISPIWHPGAHAPFDPVAARSAQSHSIDVVIANGKNLSNLSLILNNKPFQGTRIHN